MTNRAQFEAMLEALINDDQETAKEIFHNIVVGKSREIYEELLESDFNEGQDSGNPYSSDEEMEESEDDADDTESGDNPFDAEDDSDDAEDDSDDAEDDSEEEPFGDDEEGAEDSDMEDRVMDLEDALEDLKAEFEQLMADEENEPEHNDGMDDPEFGHDDMGMDAEPDMMMEYVNKVPAPKHGDNGNNTQSIVAKPNRMGGSASNIAQNFSTTTGGTQGGLAAPNAKVEDFGNVNKPGANAGKTAFKKKEPGHGAEKKGAAPGGNVGAETGKNSRDGEKNTTSVISKRVR
jgi:hypothetical protein